VCSMAFRPLSCLLMHCLRYFSHIDRRRSNVPTSQPRALDDPYITESGDNLLDLKFSKLLLPRPCWLCHDVTKRCTCETCCHLVSSYKAMLMSVALY
jgi:hypothetical protein